MDPHGEWRSGQRRAWIRTQPCPLRGDALRHLLYGEGELYSAGPHDQGFRGRYEEIRWIDDNVLRLSYLAPREPKTRSVTVRNEGSMVVRWLRITTSEVFLLLDLHHGQAWTGTTRWRGDPTFDAFGELSTGQRIHGSGMVPDKATALVIVVRDDGAALDFR
ncbi:MAG: hypothetical protein H0U67_10580 [Gemmatimonadetes bacterium]|nr:hypothetical protein [Gemmatimonadota bacterium]